jgi:hypothetical protein
LNFDIRGDLFPLGPDAEVQRQTVVHAPVVLDEEAQVVDVDVADRAELAPGVVAIGAAHAATVERRAGRIPVEGDVRGLFRVQHIVADALELHAGLEGVVAGEVPEE